MAWYPLIAAAEAPELAFALGDMILAWSYAEEHQTLLFGALLGIPANKAAALYSRIPTYHAKSKALAALVEENPAYDVANNSLGRLNRLSKTRNQYVHGLFMRERGEQEIRLCRLDQPINARDRVVTTKATDVSNHAQAVRQAALDLGSAIKDLECYATWSASAFP